MTSSNKFACLVARIVLVVAVVFGFAPMLTACGGEPERELPAMQWLGDVEPGTSPAGRIDHFVRHATGGIGVGISIILVFLFLLVVPWVAVIGTLESLFGKLEVPVEAGLILLASLGLWGYSDTINKLGMGWWLLGMDVIPAVLALIFQKKKRAIFAIPAVGAIGLLVVMGYALIVDAFAEHSVVMIGGGMVVGVLLLIWWLARKK